MISLIKEKCVEGSMGEADSGCADDGMRILRQVDLEEMPKSWSTARPEV